jgi:hypothetical protein
MRPLVLEGFHHGVMPFIPLALELLKHLADPGQGTP